MALTAKRRIIAVDDDALTLKLLVRHLEQAGYSVQGYGDGRSALEPICEMSAGIVIADWSMPEMDGLQLCNALQELKEMQAIRSIYFILLTAHSTKDKVVQGLEAGANDYLTKPYHPGELLARVQVGERMLALQDELLRRNIEVQKANAQMALLAQKLDQLANSDALTRLANRRSIFDRFEDVWKQSDDDNQPLSCIMLDVDKFKRINDTYGHAAGDEVLRVTSAIIRRTARRPEMCGRFGGEEFLLLLPNTHAEDAAAHAENLREQIAREPVPFEGTPINVSISCGVAEKSPETTQPDELVSQADAMLYAAKTHGRNQTWVYVGNDQGKPATPGAETVTEADVPPDNPVTVEPEPREEPVDSLQSVHANSDHQ